jgi:murein L,D-transpeptidase YafK
MLLFSTLALLVGLAGAPEAKSKDPCQDEKSSIVVDTKKHRLFLCLENATVGTYRVAIGKGGTPKRKQGDSKTPLGRYALGKPRPSKRYGTFIPVGYPTRKQREQGYTGSAIGIHGPDRSVAWLGALTLLTDWTQGCVAVGTDSTIDEIAAWVEKNGVKRIRLL